MGERCDRHYTMRGNGTVVFGEYESIPKTFVLNLVAWPLLLLLFSVLRKLAWDYGRIALVNRDEERWMSLFFGERRSETRRPRSAGSVESLDRTMKRQDNKGFCSWLPAFFRLKDEHIRRKCGNDAVQYLQFQRYLISYSVVICLISLGVILPINFNGEHYAPGNFARTTISNLEAGDPQLWIHFLLSIVYLVMALVFMRHFSKNLQFYEDEQASRTLMVTNVPTRRSVCDLTSLIQKHFRHAYGRFGMPESDRVRLVDVQFAFDIRRLLRLDQNRARAKLALINMDLLTKQHADSDSPVESQSQYRLALVDDVEDRRRLHDDLPGVHSRCDSRVCVAANGCDCPTERTCPTTLRPTLHPYVCGQLLCCNTLASVPFCSCCAEVDAERYYRNEVERYTRECAAEQRRALAKPCGVVFLTFETPQQARTVLIDFKRTNLLAPPTPRSSSCANDLRLARWNVEYSPEANNIFWENLPVSSIVWWLKAVAINLAVFVVAFLFTTPSFIVNELRRADLDSRLALAFERDVSFFVEFVHLLIIVLFSSLLPYLVFYTNQFVGNWTRSTAHLVVMYKSFIFLVLMIIVLPSIGFTSALLLVLAFFRSVFVEKTTEALNQNWRCIFEPSNGAFFVRYVMTAGFIGTSLELLRFADLFLFTVRMLAARSVAERATIRKQAIDEFEFGRNYAHQLCVFTVLVAYSIPVPLVTPFGVIYIALRYAVDRHNLYFAYKPSRIDKHIHTSAINFFMSSLILLQLNVVFYLTTKSVTQPSAGKGASSGVSESGVSISRRVTSMSLAANSGDYAWQILQVSAIGTFLVTLIVFCGCSMFDWFKNVSPVVYTSRQNSRLAASGEATPTFTPAASFSRADRPNRNGNGNGNGSSNGSSNGNGNCKSNEEWTQFESNQNPSLPSDSTNGVRKSHFASDGESARHQQVSHSSSASQQAGTAESRGGAAGASYVVRRSGARKRGTAFVPSVLLERYDELPLAHGETCDCSSRMKVPASPKFDLTRPRGAAHAGAASSSDSQPARDSESRVLIHVNTADDASADYSEEKEALDSQKEMNKTDKTRDRIRRSISLSPQSRAGYETIEMQDHDDEFDECQDTNEEEEAGRLETAGRTTVSPARRSAFGSNQDQNEQSQNQNHNHKRFSFDLSSVAKIADAAFFSADKDRSSATHARTKTHPPNEPHNSLRSEKRSRANTVGIPNASNVALCPQITVTAPTPIRERSVELLSRTPPNSGTYDRDHRTITSVSVKQNSGTSASESEHEDQDQVTDHLLRNDKHGNERSSHGNTRSNEIETDE